jgi:glucose-1-phosphate adenylyltransferase
MRDVLCLILGGGRGTRLYPLTKHRSKPAVPVAGKYRLIDIPISNCINSELPRVYVLTQFLSVSLHRHISHTYKFDPFSSGFVEILAAQQTIETTDWYQGTADAIRQQLRYIEDDPCEDVLVLSGDQLYRMDFRDLLRTHRETEADATLAVLPVPYDQVGGFGLVRLDDTGRIRGFVEKPQTDDLLPPFRTPEGWMEERGISSKNRPYVASMGIYAFRRQALLDMLTADPPAKDFGKEVFPRNVDRCRLQAHLFDGYWEDLGTVKAYHEASLALASDDPPFVFHSQGGVIYTRMRFLPASRISNATLQQCLVSEGCIIHPDSTLELSIIGVRSRIGRGCTIRRSVIIGADRFETDEERQENRRRGIPSFTVGDNTTIENAIVDKDCRIGSNVRIVNKKGVQDEETKLYVIRDGIVAIPRGTSIPDGTEI